MRCSRGSLCGLLPFCIACRSRIFHIVFYMSSRWGSLCDLLPFCIACCSRIFHIVFYMRGRQGILRGLLSHLFHFGPFFCTRCSRGIVCGAPSRCRTSECALCRWRKGNNHILRICPSTAYIEDDPPHRMMDISIEDDRTFCIGTFSSWGWWLFSATSRAITVREMHCTRSKTIFAYSTIHVPFAGRTIVKSVLEDVRTLWVWAFRFLSLRFWLSVVPVPVAHFTFLAAGVSRAVAGRTFRIVLIRVSAVMTYSAVTLTVRAVHVAGIPCAIFMFNNVDSPM